MFRSFWSKFAAALTIFLVAVGGSFLVPLTPPPVFEAAARVWVQARTPMGGGSSSDNSIGGAYGPFSNYFNSPIGTAAEVMRSTLVIENAIQKLRKKVSPDQIPSVGQIKSGLRIEPVRDADILAVYYRDKLQFLTIEVVQAVLDAFVDVNLEQATANAKQSRIFLENQLKLFQKESANVSNEIRAYQDATGIVNLSEQVSSVLTQIATVETTIRETQVKRDELQFRARLLEERLGLSPDETVTIEKIGHDDILSGLKQKIAMLEMEYSQLGIRFTPDHPRMRQIRSLLTQLQTLFNKRMQTELGEAGIADKGTKIAADDTFRQRELAELIAVRTELGLQEFKLKSLYPALEEAKGQLTGLPDEQVKMGELMRAQQVAIERVSDIERSLSAAKLTEAVTSNTSSYQIIDRPEITGVTIASKVPKVAGALLVALFLGVAVYFGLDFLDPRLRRIGPILKTLPLPVIGWMQHLPSPGNLEQSLEAMHRIRMGLKAALTPENNQIVVTSSDTADGKSMIAAGLALSLAQSGARVLLVDANLTHPSLQKVFKLPDSAGLSDYLANPTADMWSKIIHNAGRNLKVVTAGTQAGSAGQVFMESMQQLMQQAKEQADVVIYDTPATSKSAAALAFLGRHTHLLVIARLAHTLRPTLRLLSTELRNVEFASGSLVLVNVDEDDVAAALAKSVGADSGEEAE